MSLFKATQLSPSEGIELLMTSFVTKSFNGCLGDDRWTVQNLPIDFAAVRGTLNTNKLYGFLN